MQGQLARKQNSEQRGRESAVCCLPTSKSSNSELHDESNLSLSSLQISALPRAAQLQVTALTLAAKLDVSQVIRDPRVPVHFGNKVKGEGIGRKMVKEMGRRSRGAAA